MGWRFRKSFKILPGFRLNIGKKGISSATLGKRGLSASIGKLGIFRNIGIPGTGLSHRSKIDGSPSAADVLTGLAILGAIILGVILLCILFVVIGRNISQQEQPKPAQLVSNSLATIPISTPTLTPQPVKSRSIKKKRHG